MTAALSPVSERLARAAAVAAKLPTLTSPDDVLTAGLPVVLELEGGYANDPDDPGGATMHGITQRVYDGYRKRQGLACLPVIRIGDDEVRDIYRAQYWRDGSCDRIAGTPVTHPRLTLCHFDAAVNTGTYQAAKHLQRSVYADDDGVIGPITIERVRQSDDVVATSLYLEHRAGFYRELAARRPTSAKFLPGWLARLRWIARATGAAIAPNFREDTTT